MMNNIVTAENFWEQHEAFKALAKHHAFKQLRLKWGVSLLGITVKRLLLSYIVVPGTLLFWNFLLFSYNHGLITALNVIFIDHTESVTAEMASAIVIAWHLLALLAFGFFCLFERWDSPVNKRVRKEMEIWWHKHSPHLPNA